MQLNVTHTRTRAVSAYIVTVVLTQHVHDGSAVGAAFRFSSDTTNFVLQFFFFFFISLHQVWLTLRHQLDSSQVDINRFTYSLPSPLEQHILYVRGRDGLIATGVQFIIDEFGLFSRHR